MPPTFRYPEAMARGAGPVVAFFAPVAGTALFVLIAEWIFPLPLGIVAAFPCP